MSNANIKDVKYPFFRQSRIVYAIVSLMKTKNIKNGNTVIAYIHLPDIDRDLTACSRKRLIFLLSKGIQRTDVGYAGFKNKKKLRHYLMKTVFDKLETSNKFLKTALDGREIVRVIKNTVIPCSRVLTSDPVHIFVFPTVSNFVKEKMFGTTGYAPWKNTIMVFINLLSTQWARSLTATVSHEFNHSVFLKYNKCKTLLDSMIFEGLAEHFRERAIGGKRAPWSRVLGRVKSKKLCAKMELNELLQSTDPKTFHSVFFGGSGYIMWTGYTIGYHIVHSFFCNNSHLPWEEIMAMSPQEIFLRSRFLQ